MTPAISLIRYEINPPAAFAVALLVALIWFGETNDGLLLLLEKWPIVVQLLLVDDLAGFLFFFWVYYSVLCLETIA